LNAPLLDRSYPADPAILGQVRADLQRACECAECPAAHAHDLVLAVNEACMNVIQHAYRDTRLPEEDRVFVLRLARDDASLVVHLLDRGRKISESDLKPRPLDEIRPGGLGVSLIRELTDCMKYLPAPESFANLLELRKDLG
jgi:sigma-B regulation protein RsbU (phosphoserine phosphatase)